MKSIKIDDEVYSYLQKKAIAFEEDPNDVLRRLFGLHQVNTQQKPLPAHIKVPIKQQKQPKTNLKDLVSDGVTKPNQDIKTIIAFESLIEIPGESKLGFYSLESGEITDI